MTNAVATADVTSLGALLASAMSAVIDIMYSILSTIIALFTQPAVIASAAGLAVIVFIFGWVRKKLTRH